MTPEQHVEAIEALLWKWRTPRQRLHGKTRKAIMRHVEALAKRASGKVIVLRKAAS